MSYVSAPVRCRLEVFSLGKRRSTWRAVDEDPTRSGNAPAFVFGIWRYVNLASIREVKIKLPFTRDTNVVDYLVAERHEWTERSIISRIRLALSASRKFVREVCFDSD